MQALSSNGAEALQLVEAPVPEPAVGEAVDIHPLEANGLPGCVLGYCTSRESDDHRR